jgi:excisionase family DNA binding protein
VIDATGHDATPEATSDATADVTTPQAGTSRHATVREAAEILGVSTETIRRMIRAGRLQAQRVHRPQGTAFLVELPDAAAETTQDATGDTMAGRPNAAGGKPLPPALVAAEAWARGVIEPLTRTIADQQQQLIELARENGHLVAERDQARAEVASLKGSQAQQASNSGPVAPEATTDAPMAVSSRLRTLAPWMLLVAILLVAIVVGWLR